MINNVDELTRHKSALVMRLNVFNKWHNEYENWSEKCSSN